MAYFWRCPKCLKLDTFGDYEDAQCLRDDCDDRAKGLADAAFDLEIEREEEV
jgi:hypothetical protein